MILKRSFYLSFAFLLVLWVLILSYFMILTPSDYEEFQKMNEPALRIHSFQTKTAQQLRKGVQKDIWYSEGLQRNHLQIKSEYSELDLLQKNQKLDVIEHFEPVQCTIQEGEETRHFTAKNGAYEFSAHRLWADEVKMKFLKNNLSYFRGNAEKVFFSMDQTKLSFIAEKLKADIDLEKISR